MAVGSPFLRSLDCERHGLEWLLAGGRPRASARRRQRGGDGPLDRRRRREGWGRTGRPGGGSSARPRPTSTSFARTSCGRCCTCRATRCGWSASGSGRGHAGDAARPLVADAAGAGAVRRRRRACVQPAEPADELLGRRGADLRVPRVRLAGRARRLAARSPMRSRRCSARTAGRSRPAAGDAHWPSCRRGRRGVRPRARRRSPRSRASGCRRGWRAPTAATATGPGAFKVDLAVEGGVPWTNEACRRAGHRPCRRRASRRSSHRRARRSTAAGCPSGRSCWSASSTSPIRSGRSGDVHPVWAYAHVPSGYSGRRDRGGARPDRAVRAGFARADRRDRRPRARPSSSAYNANYVGGDIITGANTPVQLLFRPRLVARPVRDGIAGRLHLLGRDASGRRGARDERVQRRPVRASPPRIGP